MFDLAPERPRTLPAAAHQPAAHPAPSAAIPSPTPTLSPTPTPSPTPSSNPTPVATAPTQSPSPSASASPDSRSTSFQAVHGGQETRSGETLLVEAYAVLWIILMTWLVLLWRKQGGLNGRIDDLERAIDRAAAKAEKDAKKG